MVTRWLSPSLDQFERSSSRSLERPVRWLTTNGESDRKAATLPERKIVFAIAGWCL
jgi:hypothetical protein